MGAWCPPPSRRFPALPCSLSEAWRFSQLFARSNQPCLSVDGHWPVDKSHISCSHLPRSKRQAARGLKLWPRLQPLKPNCATVLTTTVCRPPSMPASKYPLKLKRQKVQIHFSRSSKHQVFRSHEVLPFVPFLR